MPTVEEVCGPYPAASNYADSYVDANGATILKPLTPDQNARYLADVAKYQQCQSAVQGVPLCPPGQYFTGNLSGDTWLGHCVSDYTGQWTTPDIFIPVADVSPTMPPIATAPAPTSPTTPAPTTKPTTTPTTTPKPTTPATTPAAGSGPSSGVNIKLGAKYVDPGVGSYCDLFPDDPFCDLVWPIGGGGIGGGGTTVTNTTVIEQVGLLAGDVHQAIDTALQGLWGLLTTTLDVVFAGAIAQIQSAITDIGNAVKAVWNILSRLSGLILNFLGHLWYNVLHGLVLAVQDIAGIVKTVFDDFLKPLLNWLRQLRQKILDIWKRFVVPVLIVIQDVRKVLAILAAFHVKWAAKLDLKLADLERKITQPLLTLLGYINQLANWMNLIATAGYLLQKPFLLNSIKAYVGSIIGLQVNAMNQPAVNAATLQQQAALSPPTVQQSKADLTQFLGDGTGAYAAPIADAHSAFEDILQRAA